MHHDNEATLAAKKVDEQLKEGVDSEGFVDISERIDPKGYAEGGQRCPRRDREYRNHDEYADDMALEKRLAVILGLQEYGSVESIVSVGVAYLQQYLAREYAYTKVSRHATSAATPAHITTALPKPEPVPPLMSCSPLAIAAMVSLSLRRQQVLG